MRSAAFGLDTFLAIASILSAFLLRLGELPSANEMDLVGLGLILLVFVVSQVVFGLNRGSWRYISIADLNNIMKCVLSTHCVWIALLYFGGSMLTVPRSVPIISALILTLSMAGVRIAYRAYKEYFARSSGRDGTAEPVLVLGYGDQADSFIRALRRIKKTPYTVLGLIDVSDRNAGRQLHGISVIGEFRDLKQIVEDLTIKGFKPRKILVSTEKVQVSQIAPEVEWAATVGIQFLGLPNAAIVLGQPTVDVLKPHTLHIEDLLGRRHSNIDLSTIRSLVEGRAVMVTGAGGSIGTELVRQLAMLNPRRLTLLDNGEFNLYRIDMEIRALHPALDVGTFYCDVRDNPALAKIMRAERPEFVCHAAALKHVPLVEENPLEGLHTNVLGTRNLADLAVEVGTRVFVMISTDKAVNPTNVMGASKRFAEAYCQMLDQTNKHNRFVTVRFGNVLGSAGSVVPLFKDQIEAGGPVTVTHPDIERYFMTINEAVTLVLAASAANTSDGSSTGKIMVLDMGSPIKIVDLAKRMIQLAGMVPDQDIKIVYSGLRPGEKMFEEKFDADELIEGTSVPWLLMAKPRVPDVEGLHKALTGIEAGVRDRAVEVGLAALRIVVPDLKNPAPVKDQAVKDAAI